MDRMLMNKELREMKEKLLDFVNDIIVRQNTADPMLNFQQFQVEISARKSLKELLAEFQNLSEELKKKQTSNEAKIRDLGN